MERLGLVIDDDVIRSLDAAGDSVTRLIAMFRSPFAQVVSAAAELVMALGSKLEGVALIAKDFLSDVVKVAKGVPTTGFITGPQKPAISSAMPSITGQAAVRRKALDLELDLELSLLSATEKRERTEKMIAEHLAKGADYKSKQKEIAIKVRRRNEAEEERMFAGGNVEELVKLEEEIALTKKKIKGTLEGLDAILHPSSKFSKVAALAARSVGLPAIIPGGNRNIDRAQEAAATFAGRAIGLPIPPYKGDKPATVGESVKALNDPLTGLVETLDYLKELEKRKDQGQRSVAEFAKLDAEVNVLDSEIAALKEKSGSALDEAAAALNLASGMKQEKSDSFTPISDELSRIGGFIGASGTPQDGVKTEVSKGNDIQNRVLEQVKTLVVEVKDLRTKLSDL
jgi:hypothetical protein